jgi:DNA helicase-2/ATP-dependent DNA helicase PcrA
LELHDQGTPLAEIAIIYRSHWQSLEMQLELTRRGIPFSIRSGQRFFEQAHIKDLIAHLKIVLNPRDEASWKRILKLLPGIGRATTNRIWQSLSASNDPLALIVQDDYKYKPKATEAWRCFTTLIKQIGSQDMEDKPAAQIDMVLASGYAEYLKNNYENSESRIEDLHQLANYAARFDNVEQFLSDLALIGSERFGVPDGPIAEDATDSPDEDDHVVLTSIHQAKGIEWQIVFIVWAADGKFPSARNLKSQTALEEERRLFYVATTRARDELYLCYPLIDNDQNRLAVIQRPSRFVTEVAQELFEVWAVD